MICNSVIIWQCFIKKSNERKLKTSRLGHNIHARWHNPCNISQQLILASMKMSQKSWQEWSNAGCIYTICVRQRRTSRVSTRSCVRLASFSMLDVLRAEVCQLTMCWPSKLVVSSWQNLIHQLSFTLRFEQLAGCRWIFSSQHGPIHWGRSIESDRGSLFSHSTVCKNIMSKLRYAENSLNWQAKAKIW